MSAELIDTCTSGTTRAALRSLLGTLGHLAPEDRATALLRVAADLIETSAYGLAGFQASTRIARLILMSAEVSRVADALGPTAPAPEALRQAS